jgi:hypothetical protein
LTDSPESWYVGRSQRYESGAEVSEETAQRLGRYKVLFVGVINVDKTQRKCCSVGMSEPIGLQLGGWIDDRMIHPVAKKSRERARFPGDMSVSSKPKNCKV